MMHKTCPINYGHLADLQKALPTIDLNKKKLSFDKISPRDFYFCPFFSICTCTLMGWVSWPLYIFIYLGSFSALWWPNIWPKKGFPELFEKTNDSIHFIPGIYPNGVSFFTPIHFRVPSLIFVPLVAKNLAENGVSRIFWKKLLTQFTSYLASILMGWVSWPLYIFVFLASFSALWWPNIWLKMGFPGFFFFFNT